MLELNVHVVQEWLEDPLQYELNMAKYHLVVSGSDLEFLDEVVVELNEYKLLILHLEDDKPVN